MKRKFDVKLRKVGNSYVVTVPIDTVNRFELEEGDFLALTFDSKDIQKQKPNKKLNNKKKEPSKDEPAWQ